MVPINGTSGSDPFSEVGAETTLAFDFDFGGARPFLRTLFSLDRGCGRSLEDSGRGSGGSSGIANLESFLFSHMDVIFALHSRVSCSSLCLSLASLSCCNLLRLEVAADRANDSAALYGPTELERRLTDFL